MKFYGKVDHLLCWHRKTRQAGNAAMGVWARGLSWTVGNEQDGYIPDDVARSIGTARQIQSLLDAGYWEPALVGGGYVMHDYDDHNITAAEWRELRQKRADAGRKGGLARGEASA